LHHFTLSQETIVALSTPHGQSAIAVIRVGGSEAIRIVDEIFVGKKLSLQHSHTIHFGKIMNYDEMIDEVVVTIYKNPHSFTGEDTIEISCHGSMYIVQRIIEMILQQGARLALPGEFTKRAFLHGKLDLSQAEAVADIIASENESQHRMAIAQMRGSYSQRIADLRQALIDFAALLELELDFSEEDLEFANREKFLMLVNHCIAVIGKLIQSFQLGNVMKHGIPVAIVGNPNVGKSTLLNQLLHEEKAIVSDIAGTTRDFIEDTLQINGVTYRFIDTAGLRETTDVLEVKGIERSYEKMKQASIIIYLADINVPYQQTIDDFNGMRFENHQQVIIVLNKSDSFSSQFNAFDIEEAIATITKKVTIGISAKEGRHVDKLVSLLENQFKEKNESHDLIVSNMRHLEAFKEAYHSLIAVNEGLTKKISAEFISIDVRLALQALGKITGQISNEDILSSVFSRFCIGK
jgi:tRNA modification GTPase